MGGHFLAFIRRAHAAYGEALGLGESLLETPDTTAIANAVTNVAYAIAEYGRMMVGELDRNDPKSVARFLEAMAPLDRHRAKPRSGGGGDDDVVVVDDDPIDPDADDTDIDPNAPIPPIEG